jgi:hypothetical protein
MIMPKKDEAMFFANSTMTNINLFSWSKQYQFDIFFIFILIISILLIFGCASKASYVSIIDNSIIYNGMITKEGADELLDIIKKKKANHFYINSIGGSSEEGLRIGEFVQENNISVTVAGRCYSSCANYIFFASKNRNMVIGSKIGLHGGYQSVYPKMLKLKESLPTDVAKSYEHSVNIQESRMKREIILLKNSNINPKIIEESASMTYYGDVNFIVKIDGKDKKFTLAKEKYTNYELWFPHDEDFERWGVIFKTSPSPFFENNLMDAIFKNINDGIEVNRSKPHQANERSSMDK